MTANFHTAPCHHIRVQTPQAHVAQLLATVVAVDPLIWGDYDQVSFATALGEQRFRTLPAARNKATGRVEVVPCVELSFVLPPEADLMAVLTALCAAHAYEEPVIIVTQSLRTLHRRGTDDANPARFWNRPPEDWTPPAHRPDQVTRGRQSRAAMEPKPGCMGGFMSI